MVESTRRPVSIVVLALLLMIAGAGPGRPEAAGPSPAAVLPAADVARRSHAVALLDEGFSREALEILDALVGGEPIFGFDHLNRSVAHLDLNQNAQALEALVAAESRVPGALEIPMMRGIVHKRLRKFDEALSQFAKVLAGDPRCLEAHYQVGLIHSWNQDLERSERAFRAMVEVPEEVYADRPVLYQKALFLACKNLSQILMLADRMEESGAFRERAMAIRGAGFEGQDKDLDQGRYASPIDVRSAFARDEFRARGFDVAPAGEASREASREASPPVEFAVRPTPFDAPVTSLAAVGHTTGGLARLLATAPDRVLDRDGERWRTVPFRDPLPASGPGGILAADLDGDGREDLVLLGSDQVVVGSIGPGADAFVARGAPLAQPGIRSGLLVDQDHDGDLDLVVGHASGLTLFRNHGAEGFELQPAGAHDLTTATGFAVTGLAAGDLDDGNDLDVVAFGPDHPPRIFLSGRGGSFRARDLTGPGASGSGALVDLMGTGSLDVIYPTTGGIAVLPSRGRGTYGEVEIWWRAGAQPGAQPGGQPERLVAEDLDLDGDPDVVMVWKRADGSRTLRILTLTDRILTEITPPGDALRLAGEGRHSWLLEDLDGDADLDLFVAPSTWLENVRAQDACWIRVSLEGTGQKVHRHGIGSKVMVRRSLTVHRREVRHRGEVFGIDGDSQADLVRVQWTDGVLQNHLAKGGGGSLDTRVGCRTDLALKQKRGLGGSCPYLYVHTDDGLEFVTDALCGAPLGLPLPHGVYAASDRSENLAVPRGSPRGPWRYRLTEEYREVTYLDRARLLVVDHPPGVEVLPDERMAPPPFPPPGIVAVKAPRPLPRVTTGDGTDVTAEVSAIDNWCPAPPETATQGVAPEHTLILDLGPVPPGQPAVLLLHGWIYWTDAGINTRLAQEAPSRLYPPLLEAPTPGGGWHVVRDDMGFPAGRPKSMILDVTNVLVPGDPRLRIRTTMRVHWDAIRIAVFESPAERRRIQDSLRITELAPARVDLTWHGFSTLTEPGRGGAWIIDAGDPQSLLEAQWIVPRGRYTRYGDVRELALDDDDRFIVIGPGDGIDFAFESPAPPPPGMERDQILNLTGYCKDAHPATWASSTVDPLPCRDVAVYGPDTTWPAHAPGPDTDWVVEWNTRLVDGWRDFIREARSRIGSRPAR